jgi:pimeloyl-ACP methyl ester carboxylesterase
MQKSESQIEVVDLDGADIAIRRIPTQSSAGETAPMLVFLHEGLGCIGMWKDFPDAVAAATGCGALIYDRLGHGASGAEKKARDPRFFENEAQDILPALLSFCGISEPILIGHSDGGTIALLHAGTYPVRGMITEAAHVFVEPESIEGVATAKRAWRDAGFRDRLARYHGKGTAAMFGAWAEMWSADWFRDWNIEDALPAITCPLLAIQGNDDDYGTVAQIEAIVRGVSGPAERLMVPNCGHAPHIQARDAVLPRMTAFVQSLIV